MFNTYRLLLTICFVLSACSDDRFRDYSALNTTLVAAESEEIKASFQRFLEPLIPTKSLLILAPGRSMTPFLPLFEALEPAAQFQVRAFPLSKFRYIPGGDRLPEGGQERIFAHFEEHLGDLDFRGKKIVIIDYSNGLGTSAAATGFQIKKWQALKGLDLKVQAHLLVDESIFDLNPAIEHQSLELFERNGIELSRLDLSTFPILQSKLAGEKYEVVAPFPKWDVMKERPSIEAIEAQKVKYEEFRRELRSQICVYGKGSLP